jgi:hypothetical protein
MFLGEAEICVAWSAFYGMVAYTVTVTVLLSLFGIRVGKRFFNRRCRSGRIPSRENAAPMPLPALEGGQEIDLVPERRAPPDLLQEEPFEDIMMRVLGSSRNTNPFYN